MRKYQSILLSSVAVAVLGGAGSAMAACDIPGLSDTSVTCDPASGENYVIPSNVNIVTVKGGTLSAFTSPTAVSLSLSNKSSIAGEASIVSGIASVSIKDGSIKTLTTNDSGDTLILDTTNTGLIDTANLKGGQNNVFVYGGTINNLTSADGGGTTLVDGGTVKNIVSGAGKDGVIWQSGKIETINLGKGSDDLTITANVDVGSAVLDGGDDASKADGMIDTLTANGVKMGSAVLKNWEVIKMAGLLVGTPGSPAFLTVCGGTIDLYAYKGVESTINGDIKGCAQDDQITLRDGSVVTGNIEGAGGSDTIIIANVVENADGTKTYTQNSASVGGAIRGAGAGSDDSALSDKGNTIIINTSGTIDSVDSGDKADTFKLMSGTINKDVETGAGDDEIAITGGTIKGNLNTGAGKENLVFSGGVAVGSVDMGGDDDTAVVTGGTITGGFAMGDGADKYTQSGGTAGAVSLGAGKDSGGSWTGGTLASLDAGTEDDSFSVTGSATGYNGKTKLDGGAGIDDITFTNVTSTIDDGTILNWENLKYVNSTVKITDKTTAGYNPTTVAIEGGSLTIGGTMKVSGAVKGGATTNDTITLMDDAQAGSIDAGGGTNFINIMNKTGIAGSIIGGSGVDTITLDTAGSVAGVDGGAGNDVIVWKNGTVGSAGIKGGAGDDTLTITSKTYTGTTLLDGGEGPNDALYMKGVRAKSTGALITNWEALDMDDSQLGITDGSLNLSGGTANLTNGSVLDGGSNFALNGSLKIDQTSSFIGHGDGNGVYSISGNVTNAGTIDIGGGGVGDSMTIGGNLDGNGTIKMDFNSSTLKSDTLLVKGNASGTTLIALNNVTAANGKATSVDGSKLITVEGTQTDKSFALANGPVVGGAYKYDISKGAGSDWVMKSTTKTGVAPTMFLESQSTDLARLMLGARAERVGFQENSYNTSGAGKPDITKGAKQAFEPTEESGGGNVWGRLIGNTAKATYTSSLGGESTSDELALGVQMGADALVDKADDGSRLRVGGALGYGRMTSSVAFGSAGGSGVMDTNGWAGSLYATYDSADDWFAHASVQAMYLEAQAGAGSAAAVKTNGMEYGVSLEGGKAFAMDDYSSLELQAQLLLTTGGLNAAVDATGQLVQYDNSEQVSGRIGAKLKSKEIFSTGDGLHATGWVNANLWHSFIGSDRTMKIGATDVTFGQKSTWADLGAGVDMQAAKDLYVNVQASAQMGLDASYYGLKGQVGARWEF